MESRKARQAFLNKQEREDFEALGRKLEAQHLELLAANAAAGQATDDSMKGKAITNPSIIETHKGVD